MKKHNEGSLKKLLICHYLLCYFQKIKLHISYILYDIGDLKAHKYCVYSVYLRFESSNARRKNEKRCESISFCFCALEVRTRRETSFPGVPKRSPGPFRL